jgi:hypothetical protein
MCLRFNSAAPAPQAPITDPTPDEQWQAALAEQAAKDQQKALAEASKPEEKSAFGKLSAFASKAVTAVDSAYNSAHASAETKAREYEHKTGSDKFTINFPELIAAGDKFIVAYDCGVMSAGKLVQGTMYLSERYLCFASDTLKDAVPWPQVASLQKSLALKTENSAPDFFMIIPAPNVLPTAIQVFTSPDGGSKLLQFSDFETLTAKATTILGTGVKGRAIDRAINWIDHCWRKMTPVPVPGVTYAR